MISIRFLCAAAGLAALAACNAAGPGLYGRDQQMSFAAPPDAPPGTCWGRDESPAVIETVTHHMLDAPAQINPDGSVAHPPVYRTETSQEIVTPRRDLWFETPCPAQMTPELVASLQRALAARGVYDGKVTGEMDAKTSAAIRRHQAAQGLNSAKLSLDTAQRLGLVVVPLDG